MKPFPSSPSRDSFPAFSLLEVLAIVSLLGLLITFFVPTLVGTHAGVAHAKLESDVAVLNRAVSLYVAEGGNVDNAANAQDVIERLKTRLSENDARRHVGPSTGRLVDPRLAARELPPSKVASNVSRAVWDPSLKKFVIATQGDGIADFYFDDQRAGLPTQHEARAASTMLYNGHDGWIWDWSKGGDTAPPPPTTVALLSPRDLAPIDGTGSPSGPGGGTFDPDPSTPPKDPETLPTPNILPLGGTFSVARFPSSIIIGTGGAPSEISALQYRLDSGAWQNYTAPFTVPPGTRVFARNRSLDTSRYLNSAEDTELYLGLVSLFSGTLVPDWRDMLGKDNLVKTLDNLLSDHVKATYGKPSESGTPPNSLEFDRAAFISVPPDTDFKIGGISYYNGTVVGGTEATSINLNLKLLLTNPSIVSGNATAHLSLWSSTNTNNAAESADYIQVDNPKTDFAVTIDGVTYTLQLRFANIAAVEGWTDGTKLFVYEGSKGHADLIARFVSSY